MKKVIIIGAGVTGLSAGIHALLKGHEVSIYEKNDIIHSNGRGRERA